MISKSVDAPTLKIIQDTIAEQKFDMSVEDAIVLFKGPLREWMVKHNGAAPSIDSPNVLERELAQAVQILKNQKLRHMMGLNYDPDVK